MSNFRLCGDMAKRRWKVSEKRRAAETRWENSERFGRKNAHVRGKVGKSRRTVFVQSVDAPDRRVEK